MLNWFVLKGFWIIIKKISIRCLKDGVIRKKEVFSNRTVKLGLSVVVRTDERRGLPSAAQPLLILLL